MTPFAYREFYDVPRAIILTYRGRSLFLTSTFEEERDDYSLAYEVYEIPTDVARIATLESREFHPTPSSWIGIEKSGTLLGSVPVAAVNFDRTLRAGLDASVLDAIVEEPHWQADDSGMGGGG